MPSLIWNMETITFNCRFITPAFLGGADPKGTPELRAPSIKGALRFWWRAMNGYLVKKENGNPTYQYLLKEDEDIFGGIYQVMQKSPIIVRVVEKNMRYTKGGDIFRGGQIEGIEYLFYSLKHHKRDDLGFDTESKFDIIFSCREENRDILLKALASFWLLVNLGSLGTRARRCAGAFCIDSIEDKMGILQDRISFFTETDETTIDFLKANFKKISELIGSKKPVLFKKYSLLNQTSPAYLSNQTFSTWQDAVNSIGGELRSTRKGKTSRIKSERTFTIETLDKKAAFGIPG
ncbi:MAG: type III-B CRISPR module RAMP protein Cmr1 [Saprospiraceae bacterium]|nr:type III-B CRISPR module RAMP protein Cmr1 [Saprospiraceae bacterium]